MSVEENKAVVRRFHEELFNQKNFSVADEILDAKMSFIRLDGTPAITSREEYVEWMKGCFEALPDYHIVYSDLMGEGNLVAFRWTVYGTLKAGVQWGTFSPVAEDTKIEWSGIDIFHLENGKIVKYYPCARWRIPEDGRK